MTELARRRKWRMAEIWDLAITRQFEQWTQNKMCLGALLIDALAQFERFTVMRKNE